MLDIFIDSLFCSRREINWKIDPNNIDELEKTFNFILKVYKKNNIELFDIDTFKIIYSENNYAPVFGKTSKWIVEEGKSYEYKIPVEDPNVNDSILIENVGAQLPRGMRLNKKDKILYFDIDYEHVDKVNNTQNYNLELKSKTSLETIHYYDKNFSPNKFLSGAKKAFELIIESYAKGEINKIKHLISTNIFSIFSKEIKLRIKKKNSLEHSLVSIKSADIEKINVKSSIADIVVKFVSEQVNLLKNEKGKVLKGNDEYIENHTDYWTFSKDLKSNNPNWKLVVTKTG